MASATMSPSRSGCARPPMTASSRRSSLPRRSSTPVVALGLVQKLERRVRIIPSNMKLPLPQWIPPQLTQLVETAPSGPQWLHEIKLDGFRMAARIERGRARVLTRTALDWSAKDPAVLTALAAVRAKERPISMANYAEYARPQSPIPDASDRRSLALGPRRRGSGLVKGARCTRWPVGGQQLRMDLISASQGNDTPWCFCDPAWMRSFPSAKGTFKPELVVIKSS